MLTTWIVRNRRDLVAIHANGFSELHLIALGAAITRVPVVAWFHGSRVDPWDERLAPVWRRLISNGSFVAVSELARDVVVTSGLAVADQIMIVPNPIEPRDVRAARPPRVGGSERHALVVGYLGSTTRDKGFDLLPEIIERTRECPLTWALFLPRGGIRVDGDRPVWSELERLRADGRVAFPGRRADVREAYAGCDIVICPSRMESFGRVVVEAMMNGLPVVASDIGPFRDLLGDGGGMLFPSGDAAAAAAALAKLVADPVLRDEIGQRARVRASCFEPSPIVRRFEDLYGWQPTEREE
jgi:glycosyltransferase involved in cell wall biosynthesis